MTDLSIDQILFDGDIVRARSTEFVEEWVPLAEEIRRKFGPIPGDPLDVLFVISFGSKHVAIGRVSGARLHLLVLSQDLYDHLHDPFAIAERFPVPWEARGSLPDLDWPPQPLPRRTTEMLDAILKNGDGPFLLGASQALVDGAKIAFQQSGPAMTLFRDLWSLLPASIRRTTWLATYTTSNELGFDLLAMPVLPEVVLPGYLNEDQARDYPDSRYERHLQIAVEAKDQRALDHLLARKSTSEMINLALLIIGLSFGIVAVVKVLTALRVI